MTLGSYIEGWLEATDGAEKEVLVAAIMAEHQRVFALFEAMKAVDGAENGN
jgi:hypothetical protein